MMASVSKNSYVNPELSLPEEAVIRGEGLIDSAADYFIQGPGDSGKFTTAHRDRALGVRVNRECFSGTLEQFRRMIEVYGKISERSREQGREYADNIQDFFGLGS